MASSAPAYNPRCSCKPLLWSAKSNAFALSAATNSAHRIRARRDRAPEIPVEAADSPEAAVRDADIIVTSTNATKPVVEGRWLQPGTHINAIGANFPQKRELYSDAVARENIIAAIRANNPS